jgi:hypothetical protein
LESMLKSDWLRDGVHAGPLAVQLLQLGTHPKAFSDHPLAGIQFRTSCVPGVGAVNSGGIAISSVPRGFR